MEPKSSISPENVSYRRSLTASEYQATHAASKLQRSGLLPSAPWDSMAASKVTYEGSRMLRTFVFEWEKMLGMSGPNNKSILRAAVDLRCMIGGAIDRKNEDPEKIYESAEAGHTYAREWKIVGIRLEGDSLTEQLG
jgi:hypothetical protein